MGGNTTVFPPQKSLAGLQASAAEIDASVNGDAHPQLTEFLYNLSNNKRSMSIMFCSDSTGNENTEFIYLFSQWLATTYPAYTVRYRLWNDTSNNYDSAVLLNTGTGTYFIDVWNFAVSGTNPTYIINPNRITNGLYNVTNTATYTDASSAIDLIITNHGHNIVESDKRTWNIGNRMAEFVEIALISHPHAGVVVFRQNPTQDFSNEPRIRGVYKYAASRGFCIANAWDKFIDAGMDASLFNDNTHPSATGTLLMLEALTEQMTKNIDISTSKRTQSTLSIMSKNFAPNGLFSTWTNTSATPDLWTVSGGTASKDTSVFDDPVRGYSCKVIATGGVACYLDCSVPSAYLSYLKGKTVTIAVRALVDSSLSAITNGRIYAYTNTETLTPNGDIPTFGAWKWSFFTISIKPTDSYFRIRIYLDSSTAITAGKTINIDRVVLSVGGEAHDAI